MSADYINVNNMLSRLQHDQISLERYVGITCHVDNVSTAPQDITQIAPSHEWDTLMLLVGQHNAQENGIYRIDSLGQFHSLQGSLEIGNLVVISSPSQSHRSDYYQLVSNIAGVQTWQPLQIAALNEQVSTCP
ncbi:hypothetical protein HQQ94_09510 [Shewanella sp. VB17]|uniref:hypothetical protein n=1 Tax=Shewanella sp. VB17 TaxID=2739432 RepID=UPI0015665C2B|nr:hypothetical protein [Shewanella sp. VB17]NRD73477.1 hypothetical protein [Shewanella sp. VB17]